MVGTSTRNQRIRAAKPEEAHILTALASRSKAHWGYDRSFIEASRESLTVTPAYIQDGAVQVFELSGEIAGFYGMSMRSDHTFWLDFLFVDPDVIGTGYGKKLWRHAVLSAGTFGADAIYLECDPYSAPFYNRMGAQQIAKRRSRIKPGMMLPVMRYKL